MDKNTGTVVLIIALIVLFLVLSTQAKAIAPILNISTNSSASEGKKAYSISDFRTLYDKNNNTVRNLMKGEYIGIITGDIPESEGIAESYEIDSIYMIPKAFVYIA